MDAALHGDSVTALGQHGKRSAGKLARIPVKIVPVSGAEVLPKPSWLHAWPMMSETVAGVAAILREHRLHSVCEEAMCPNIGECSSLVMTSFAIRPSRRYVSRSMKREAAASCGNRIAGRL